MKKSFFAIIVCFVLTISDLYAAPQISSVEGTFGNHNDVLIRGSGFGSGGPNVVLFDDFELGADKSPLAAGTRAQVGSYYSVENPVPYYTTSEHVSGSKAMQANLSSGWQPYAGVSLPGNPTSIFASWWMKLPSGNNWPGEGNPDGINWKTVWLMGASTVDDDQTMPTILDNSSTGAFTGNDTPYTKWFSLGMTKGSWVRCWVWLKGDSGSSGEVKYQKLGSSGVETLINDTGVKTLKSGGYYQRIHFNGYGRTTSNCFPTFDDIYIAVGPSARARIEVGNASTYTACRDLTMATVNNWSDTSISATFWQGRFASGAQAYVYVFDAIGNVNAQGYPIVIGGGAGSASAAPASPAGLKISN